MITKKLFQQVVVEYDGFKPKNHVGPCRKKIFTFAFVK
jgi:hypothetical protein